MLINFLVIKAVVILFVINFITLPLKINTLVIMKKILLLSMLLAFYLQAMAQSRSSISIAVGPSFPIGDFGSKNIANTESGLAAVGGFAAISYNYQFSNFFGVTASIKGSIHGIDKNALNSYSLPTGSGASLTLETTPWKFANIMGGMYQTIPVTNDEKLVLQIKELVGMQLNNSPEVKSTGYIPGIGSLNGIMKSESSTSFTYLFGLGFKYNLNKGLGLLLFGEYAGTNPKFTVTTYPADAPVKQKMAQGVSVVDLGIGLNISF